MDADFPAAHSMDSHWFAVDRDGNVAYFVSGEEGAVPAGVGQHADPVEEWFIALLSPEAPGREYLYLDTTNADFVGLFAYDHDDYGWINQPYQRVGEPAQPLHIDQLPPAIRDAVSRVRFPSLSFAEAMRLQPCEKLPCDTYPGVCAYLTAEGGIVRAVPGRESAYREEYEAIKEDLPEEMRGYRFDP
jgi:hypothetical protein